MYIKIRFAEAPHTQFFQNFYSRFFDRSPQFWFLNEWNCTDTSWETSLQTFTLPPLDIPPAPDDHNPVHPTTKKHELTNSERTAILQALLTQAENHNLKKGAIQQVSDVFKVSRNTLGHILWKRARDSLNEGNVSMDVTSRKSWDVGEKSHMK